MDPFTIFLAVLLAICLAVFRLSARVYARRLRERPRTNIRHAQATSGSQANELSRVG